MPILKYIDVLIGLSVVMILLSSVVAAITHFVNAATVAKARHLRSTLKSLVRQMFGNLTEAEAGTIVDFALRHPMTGREYALFGGATAAIVNWLRGLRERPALPARSAANAIEREELLRVLLELANPDGLLKDQAAVRTALADGLKQFGVAAPQDLLEAVAQRAAEIERAQPELARHHRDAQALMVVVPGRLFGALSQWFDQSMERSTQRFTLQARIVTSIAAAAVAFVLQVDTLQLLDRLSTDDKLRDALVQQANTIEASPTASADAKKEAEESLKKLQSPALAIVPSPFKLPAITEAFTAGVAFTWILLTLGAPFWYDLLKNLLNLRSTLAQREGAQRDERASPPSTPVAAAAAVVESPSRMVR